MLDDLKTRQSEKAVDKFHKINDRAARDFGYGDTAQSLAIASENAEALIIHITEALKREPRTDSTEHTVLLFLRLLDPEVLAVATLQTCLHAVAVGKNFTNTATLLGRNIHRELFAKELKDHDKKLFERIDAKVRKEHGSLKYRAQAARSIAKRKGFNSRAKWTEDQEIQVGGWLVDALLGCLPEVFELVIGGEDGAYYLVITEGAQHVAMEACRLSISQNPVFLPDREPPAPWVDMQHRTGGTVVRVHHRESKAAIAEAIRTGQMKPCLDALNAIQSTGWRINTRVLEVMEECFKREIDIPKFPRAREYPMPPKDKLWDDMTDLEKTQWKLKASEVKKANRVREGTNLSFSEDMATAHLFKDTVFYTGASADWRGRVYPTPHFNFQREDRVRALFLFDRGAPLGDRGLYWLKVHVANCGDFGKISKKSFDERVKWVDQNMSMIVAVALEPLGQLDWTKADKPFLFLAACMELTDALSQGSSFVSALPVSWDGSCSGVQHLSAATRGEAEAALVNLTDSEAPQDLYQSVADVVKASIEADAAEGHPIAKLALAYGVDRKLCKRNVMTFSYGSKKSGMANQQDEDLMEPLRLKVIKKELEDHPFEEFAVKRGEKVPSAAARYLAGHTYEAIKQIVCKPAQAMDHLQALAGLMAHAGKPLEWTTPVGLPWSNRYHPRIVKTVKLWLHDRGVMLKIRVATGSEKEIEKSRAKNGAPANFTHALDAAHLMLSVNAGAREGMTHFAMVHDSFGCHAARSERFHEIIREEFVRMYRDHDVLDEVYQRAKCDLNEHNWRSLPDVVKKGDLDINGIKGAKYAFA